MIVNAVNDLCTYVNVSGVISTLVNSGEYKVKVIVEKVNNAVTPVTASEKGANLDYYA